MHLRISVPSALSDDVVGVLSDDPAVSSLSVLRGASVEPSGDLVLADVAREATSEIVSRLQATGLADDGTMHVEPVNAWISRRGLEAEELSPGSSADSVVWVDVAQRAYEDSELNWTYGSFMVLATLIAAIAIVLDSQVLVIGAMVLGPEFGAVAALGIALVRRRPHLLRRAAVTLVVGFALAIAVTTAAARLGKVLGWVALQDVTGPRPETAFFYTPARWSVVVALIAGAAGVLSLTSARVGSL